ncbi:PREDICTED: putative RING-H2 finger protein ATL21A [Lupinus angustifolius]|uniref:putative RING-H2 finger protein ATL21A n=1 Tax=Lupinus angustifolius TaxID=3871 RepID=UPI00092E7873|nr:PREDICTED: putative RING-H2 finger protein ATL21A [Lupinus angustifolius]
MNNIPKLNLIFLFLCLFNTNPTSLLVVLANIETCLDSVCHMKEPTIRFPFQIKEKQPKTCGYPGFRVSCSEKGQILLKLPNSGEFSIKAINYVTQQVWLNDPNNCLPKRILSLNLSGSPFDAVYYQQFTFFNCSFNLEYLSYRYNHISCLSDSNRYHVIATSSSNVVIYLSSICELIETIKVPVQSPIYDHVLSSELTDDLRLSWESPPCGRCESHGGRCGFNFNTTNSSTTEIGCSNYPSKGISERASYIIAICIWVPALLCLVAIFSWICNKFKLVAQGWAWRIERVADFEPFISPQQAITILGLDRPTIESYPKIVLDENQLLLKPNDETCPICLSKYRPKETVKHIPECRHGFHAKCIDEWLPLNASCPICRTSPHMLPQPLDPS